MENKKKRFSHQNILSHKKKNNLFTVHYIFCLLILFRLAPFTQLVQCGVVAGISHLAVLCER